METEDPQRTHTLRVHLQKMDNRTRTIQTKPNPPIPGTEQLALEAFRTLKPFEGAEHTNKGFTPTHDRVRGSPRNVASAPCRLNEKVRAGERRRRAAFRQRER